MIPECVRKPGPARLALLLALSPQACDLPSHHSPLENWEVLVLPAGQCHKVWLERDVELHCPENTGQP